MGNRSTKLIEINETLEEVLSYKALVFSKLSVVFITELLDEYNLSYKILPKGDDLFELYLNPFIVDSFYQLYELKLFGGNK